MYEVIGRVFDYNGNPCEFMIRDNLGVYLCFMHKQYCKENGIRSISK